MAGLTLLWTAAFADILFFNQALFVRDTIRFYFPARKLVREIILSGDFPYWNRFVAGGQPLAANPDYGVFYPPNLLTLLNPVEYWFQVLIAAHVLIAVLGMFRFLRSVGLERPASFFGSLIFGLGGFCASLLNLLPYLFIFAWAPWAFRHVRALLLRPNRIDFCAAALFLGLQILVGEPTTLVQVWFLMAVFGFHPGLRSSEWTRTWGTTFSILALLLVVSACVGAAQLLPAMDLAGDSVRSRGFDLKTATAWSMPPVRLAETAVPFFFGHPFSFETSLYWGGVFYPDRPGPFLFSIYSGLFCFALVVAGIAVRSRELWIVAPIWCVSFLLAAGAHSFVFPWLHKVGIAAASRYPEKFALMGLFVTVVFAARVFQRLLDGEQKVASTAIRVLGVVSLVSIAGLVLSSTRFFEPFISSLFGNGSTDETSRLVRSSRVDLILMMLTAIALLVSTLLIKRGRGTLGLIGILVVTGLDVMRVGRNVAPRLPREFYSQPDSARAVSGRAGRTRMFHEAAQQDDSGGPPIAHVMSSRGALAYWGTRNGLFPISTAGWGLPSALDIDYDRTALLPTAAFMDAVDATPRWNGPDRFYPFTTMANAGIHARWTDTVSLGAVASGTSFNPVEFVEVPVNSRYYFADRMERIRSVDDFVEAVQHPNFTPATALLNLPPFPLASGVIVSGREGPNGAMLKVRAAGRSFLVMSITHHKYWRATLNGQPLPLHQTNLGFQGAVIPGGEHIVRMTYQNDLIRMSLALTILTTIGLLSMLVFSRIRRSALA